MSDYIKREDAIKATWQEPTYTDPLNVLTEVRDRIEAIPSAQPKRGEWIVYEGGWKDLDYYPPKCKCNQCGYEEDLYILNAKPTSFCPNCGCAMTKE